MTPQFIPLSTGLPCFIVLHLTYTVFFKKLKVYGNHALSKSTGTISLAACAHSVFLFHVLVILTIFQTFFVIIISILMVQDKEIFFFFLTELVSQATK